MKRFGFIILLLVLILSLCDLYTAAEEKEEIPKYKGEKGNFIFDEADIKNVLLFFAKTYKFNIIIDPGISGKVTVRLIDVPWDQALDLILRTQGLAFIVEWSETEKDSKGGKKRKNKIKAIQVKKLPK